VAAALLADEHRLALHELAPRRSLQASSFADTWLWVADAPGLDSSSPSRNALCLETSIDWSSTRREFHDTLLLAWSLFVRYRR
jgi:hypothetical protein